MPGQCPLGVIGGQKLYTEAEMQALKGHLQKLTTILLEKAKTVHFGRFHQWGDFDVCPAKECVYVREIVAAAREASK